MLDAGIHRIAADTYHADAFRDGPTLSSSLARLLLDRSPLHAWTAHPRLNPDFASTERKTFDIGRAAHRMVLGAGADYAVYPPEVLASNGAASTKAAKEWEAETRAAGLTPIKAQDEEAVLAMTAAVADHLAQMRIAFDPARSEIMALAEIDGAWCRAMVDNAPTDPRIPLYDFKTTENASPDACVRSVMNYGYDVQAAFYVDAWKAASGEDRAFRFVFCEKAPPYGVCVVELSGDDMSMAARKARAARALWRECLESGEWPGYGIGVHRAMLPDFYHARWLEREEADADRKRVSQKAIDAAARWQSPEPFAGAAE